MALDRGIWKCSVGVSVARALVPAQMPGATAQSFHCHLSRCHTGSCTLRRVEWLLWAIGESVGRSRWCAVKHIVAVNWEENKFLLKISKIFNIYPFAGAHTAGAWWGECRFTNAHMSVANLATLYIFTPLTQIDLGHGGAGHTWIAGNRL